jgi:predicted acyltransferase
MHVDRRRFPIFLFIVGELIALSFGARLDRGVPRRTILLQVGKRALLILAIGLILNALPYFHLSDLRYYGVMRSIALCYTLAGHTAHRVNHVRGMDRRREASPASISRPA